MEGKVVFSGDPSSLITAMQRSADAVRGFQASAEGAFGKLQSNISSVQAKWLALGSIIVSGAGFKEAVDVSVNLTKEASALGRALGINATQASILADALGDAFVTTETMTAASSKLTATLKNDEEAVHRLGVATRDGSGHFRASLDIMMDVNRELLKFKEGTDRNIEGSKIYGKSWGEVQGVLRLTGEMMADSEAKVRALNLAVGEESVENVARYRVAMDDVDDVLTAVKKTIGDAVMPVLTELGNEFSGSGPEKVALMQKAIAVLVVGFYGLKNSVEIIAIFIKASIESLVHSLMMLGEVGRRMLTLDVRGSAASWRAGSEQLKDISLKAGQDILAANEANGAAISRAMERGFNPTPGKDAQAEGAGATATSRGGDKTTANEKTRTGEWSAVLDKQKQSQAAMSAATGTFHEFSQQREADYWKAILGRQDISQKERLEVERRYTRLVLEIQKDQYEAKQAALKLEMEAFQNNMNERERIAAAIAESAAQRYGKDSREYVSAQQELVKIARKRADQVRSIEDEMRATREARAMAEIDAESEQMQLSVSLGLATHEQLLVMEASFEARRFGIKRQALQEQLSLLQASPDMDPVARAQLQRQIEELEVQHQLRLGQIRSATTFERSQPMGNAFGSLESNLDQATASMLTKQQTWGQAMGSIYKNVGTAFIQEIVTKPMAQWVAGWARKLAMNLGFFGVENAQTAAAAATGTAISTTAAGTKIGANAAVAGSGAASSLASIPFVGPALALAAMAAVFAAVSGMSRNVKSASQGFDIPRGMNPMVQTHEEEMILPSKISNGFRDIFNGNAPMPGGGGAAPVIHYNDHSGRLTRQELTRNAKVIAEVLRDHHKK